MKCRDCKYMYTNDTMHGLYICVNGKSEHLGEFTGICSEDECEDATEDTAGGSREQKERIKPDKPCCAGCNYYRYSKSLREFACKNRKSEMNTIMVDRDEVCEEFEKLE